MLSSRQFWVVVGAAVTATQRGDTTCAAPQPDSKNENFSVNQSLMNWSSTHSSRPIRYYEPESAQEACRVLKAAHLKNEKIRVVGTALSPNGIGLSTIGSALSASHIDYIEVDPVRRLVTVGAGARVSDVLKKLNEHGLTLENFSSIQEQQMAGWTQVSAHGTGCKLSTVDDMIVRMKLATPTEGLLTLSETSNAHLFQLAKVGLGSLGVVTELTMKCVPKFSLREKTSTVDSKSLGTSHKNNLESYRHVRYMWLPYTSKVVTVVSNPTSESTLQSTSSNSSSSGVSKLPATQPLYELLLKIDPHFDRQTAEKMSFSQLRDQLLGHSPLDVSLIKQVNQAEAQFWERMNGERVDDSTNILGFDCGGEQWVYEVCLPLGPLSALSGSGDSRDLLFAKRLLQLIEQHQLPAPCPIEQRWTARSTAPMSPAFSLREDDVFSWVGVIMYMPPNQTDEQRQTITRRFEQYVALMQPLVNEFNAHCHWAKIELPSKDSVEPVKDISLWSSLFGGKSVPETYEQRIATMQSRVAEKYPVKDFNGYRKVLDPKGLLSNELIDTLFADKK